MKPWTGDPWRRFGLPAHVGWLVVGAYGLAEALGGASWLWKWSGPYGTRPVDEFITVVCLASAAACAGHAARHAAGRQRFGWLALLTALLGWAVGDVIFAVYDVRPEAEHAAHPAVTEAVLTLWPIGAMASLVALSRLSRHSPRRLVLDGLIVATSLFVISWVFVLEKQLSGASSSRVATLAQVFSDIVLTTSAILMLSRVRAGDRPSRSLVAGGIATISVADIVMVFHTGIGGYHSGDLAYLTRVAGLGLLTLAALAGVDEPPDLSLPDEIPTRSRLWVPYLPLLLATTVGLNHTLGPMRLGPMFAALGVLVAAVLVRQFVMLVENQGLLSEVAREAFRDSLTGLANRARFLQRLQQAIANRSPEDAPIAVLCLDLDNFKMVNDALGHPAGDELLIRVAERLTTAVGETATVARLGGDEFAVLIEGSVEELQAAAHRILDAFLPTILIDGVPLDVRPSIGFTMAPASSSCTVDELLRHADLAMYAAKRQGGQCIHSFVPDLPLPLAEGSPAAPPARAGGGSRHRRTAPLSRPAANPQPPTTSTGDEPNNAPQSIAPRSIAPRSIAPRPEAFGGRRGGSGSPSGHWRRVSPLSPR